MGLRSGIKNLIRKLIVVSGYEIKAIGSRGLGYISADAVQQKAREKNLTVNQYLEEIWGMDGYASQIIENFQLETYLQQKPLNIVEIGAGTGIYTHKVINKFGKENIMNYQVYETAGDWVKYLKETYHVTLPSSNGYQLTSTETNSVDLAHAHYVFVYTSFITSMSYMKEMMRVVKKGGIIAFDVYGQSCFSNDIIDEWIRSGQTYPTIVPEDLILKLFTENGFTLLKSFHGAFKPGRSKYFVFIREY